MMKDNEMNFDKGRVFSRNNLIALAVMAAASVLRVLLGQTAGVWFPVSQKYDDVLMVQYADFPAYFAGNAVPQNDIMLKELGYPAVLNAVDQTGIPYSVFLSILWIIAAVLVVWLVLKFTKNLIAVTGAFVFVLFSPVAFDYLAGTRAYRNAVLTPLYFIIFLIPLILIVGLILGKKPGLIRMAIWMTVLGLVFSITYYIKEDGLWLLASLIFFDVFYLIAAVYDRIKRKIKMYHAVFLIIPILIFIGCTANYKQTNYEHFGVYETNTRTSGEVGRFVNNLYRIQSDDRTLNVWAPVDVVNKAFEASPTLKENEALYDAIIHSDWAAGDMNATPVYGDFMTWVMKDAVYDAGISDNAAGIQDYFRQVNAELKEAFDQGVLKKDDRISVLASTGGVAKDEAFYLLTRMFKVYLEHLFLNTYAPGAALQPENDPEMVAKVSGLLNEKLLYDEDGLAERTAQIEGSNAVIGVLIGIYRVVNPVLFFAALAGLLIFLVRCIARRFRKIAAFEAAAGFAALSVLLISLAYAFFIMRFSSFLLFEGMGNDVLKFYGIGMVPLLEIFMLTGGILLFREIRDLVRNRRTKKETEEQAAA